MNDILSESYVVWPAECNAEGELSLTFLTSQILALSATHADQLGIGNNMMHESGWVLSRFTYELERLPQAEERYTLSTWIETWNRHFSERCYRIALDDGTVLGYGRAVWMVISTTTHRNVGLESLNLPAGMTGNYDCPIARQERHSPISIPDREVEYVFSYSDIDYYRHVNTLRYIQLLTNLYPLEYHDANRIRRFEVAFMHESLYGAKVKFLIRNAADNAFDIHMTGDGHDLVRSRIRFIPRE